MTAPAETREICANCNSPLGPLERREYRAGKLVCPACTSKIDPPPLVLGTPEHPLLIERTAKRYKLQIALAATLTLLGPLLLLTAFLLNLATLTISPLIFYLSLTLFLAGLLWLLSARLAAWWHHG